ncbi:hypothetical protein [Microbacterium sp. UBA837]|uniref:hypothetical protein n=1 Tax=Microbacterium sp. UBA837 TaxID=1946956 RepID=UPI0025FCB9DC|nr:hypothetical protein [Microbacterium sp. UBA837]
MTRADIGKRITFTSLSGRTVEGQVRAFTHGVFSNNTKDEVDVPLVGISVYALRSHEHHWATPETLAEFRTNEGEKQ